MNYRIVFQAERKGKPRRVADVARRESARVAIAEQIGIIVTDVQIIPESLSFRGYQTVAAKSVADTMQRAGAISAEVQRYGFELKGLSVYPTTWEPGQ